MAIKKVMVSIPEEILAEVDKKSKETFVTRSAFMVASCRAYLQTLSAVETASRVSTALDEFVKANPPADKYTEGQISMLKQILDGSKDGIRI